MAAHPVSPVDTDDIQGLVLQGYGRHRAAAYLVLEVPDDALAHDWLAALLPEVTLGSTRPEGPAVNVALTPSGLRAFGLPEVTLDGFSPEFLEGMASPHRSRLLGDEGAAAPEHWAWGGPDGPRTDALLLLFAPDEAALDDLLGRQRDALAGHGLREVAVLETRFIGHHEHFGFRDGISQPVIEGTGRQGTAQHLLAAGEVLLGHLNGHRQLPPSPVVPADLDPEHLLPPRPHGPPGASAPVPPGLERARDFGRDGSYLVVRTLSQDVGGFWRFVDAATREADGPADVGARTALAARMVGRWPSGAPLTLSPDRDRAELAEENDFGYHAADREGLRCPVGSHVRRTNPRDSLPPDPGSPGSVEVGRRHRLLRRGRTFGPPVDPEHAMTEDPAQAPDRGLHFLCLCGDLARQFEFVSHTWAMNPHFAGLLEDADPLLGGHSGRNTTFTTQTDPVRRRVTGLPVFVTPRGGAYFFLPSARALRYLAHASSR